MMHASRVFRVTEVASPEELADELFAMIWTPCTAFRLGTTVWANDATSPDGAQEYAVIRDGRQVESITVSWSTRQRVADYARELLEGRDLVDMGAIKLRTDHPAGACRLCA